jgi:coenzyme PQQ synthesis protein D (PqqD)
MLRARQFRVDPSRIVHETIDGETILIDLETGTYYSLRGCGSEIWALLVAGWIETDVIREMQRRFDVDAEAVRAAVAELIAQLKAEGILDPDTADRDSEDPDDMPGNGSAERTPRRPFEAPVLERYTDMQYFLLLDPIHEVQEGGWPRTPSREAEPIPSETDNG